MDSIVTKKDYIEYLVSTPVNYTCPNLAKHLDGVSHDAVNDYLHRERLTACYLWEQVKPLLNDSPNGYLIVDDSVQAKKHARKIEFVKRQYSGNEGCMSSEKSDTRGRKVKDTSPTSL